MSSHINSNLPTQPIPALSIFLELGGLRRIGLPSLQLMYTITGTAGLAINGLRHLDQEAGSICIINPGESYEVTGMDNFAAVIFSIHLDYFIRLMPALSGVCFSAASVGVEQDDYDALALLLSQSLKIFSDDPRESALLQSSMAHRILLLLLKRFRLKSYGGTVFYQTEDDTIQKLMAYIDQHSTEKLSLPFLSDMVHLNAQYLSRLFKRETGITLIRYINQVRVLKSEKDVLRGDLSASDIADKCGFSNAKSFYKAFRAEFGKTPGEHKAAMAQEWASDLNFHLRCPSPMLYTKELVKQFIRNRGDAVNFDAPLFDGIHWDAPNTREYKITCPLSSRSGIFPHNWSYFLDFAHWEESLRQMNRTADPLPSRIFGHLNRWSELYYEDMDGTSHYNFSECDRLADYYLSKGMRLVIEIFFMPIQLALYPNHPYLWYGSMGPPENMKKWCALLTAGARHLIDRYGTDVMTKAYFQLWQDPTIPACWQGTQQEFWDFIACTCRAIKSVDSRLRVVLPGLYPENISAEWLRSLKSALDRQETALDYIGNALSFLRADPENPSDFRFPPESGKGYRLADSGYPLTAALDFKEKLIQGGFQATHQFISKALPTGLPHDQTQNTCFWNAYVVKTLLDLVSIGAPIHFAVDCAPLPPPFTNLSDFSFLSSTQIFLQSRLNIFHLLDKLGTRILRKGSHYLLTTREETKSYQILCFNYCHYRADLNHPDQLSSPGFSDGYSAFAPGESVHLTITLQKLSGTYRMNRYRLDAQHGSVYDAWLKIGAPNTLSTDVRRHLLSHAAPDYSTSVIHPKGSCSLSFSLAPHEVELIELVEEA